jgi:hypothetical protein
VAFNDELMEMNEEDSSVFASTFKCGEGNSFVTKYHSNSGAISDADKTVKRFEKSKYWRKSRTIFEEAEIETPLLDLKHVSCISENSNRFGLTSKQASKCFL